MDRTVNVASEGDNQKASELLALQSQLTSLAREAANYPLECSLGSYELLFESRDDIQIILDNLSEEIAICEKAA
jgi:hypothetical protein